ncbi:MAG: hypothetical protein CMF19_07335 [Idiomarinaceae bacterium]|nr:hypothetical protein [Idiomarinaceae bacterium]
MPIIEIGADTRGLTTSLAQADAALIRTSKEAGRTENQVRDLGEGSRTAGANMSAAFAATGGGLAITHGLEGISSGLRSGNSAMAAFAASQALLDLGRFKEDMRGVTEATGGATSVFGKLGAIMKAHPLMTIATVLAGAASVMAIFSGETEEAANEFERLGDAMEKTRLSREAARMLGVSELPEAQRQVQDVRNVANLFVEGGMTYGQMATSLQMPGQRGLQRLLELQQAGGGGLPEAQFVDVGSRASRMGILGQRQLRIEEQQVTREAAQAILRTLYRQLEGEAKQLQATGKAGGQPVSAVGAPPMAFPLPTYSPQRVDSGVTFGPTTAEGPFVRDGVRYGADYGTGAMLMRQPGDPGTIEYQRAQTAAAKANMDELIAQGEQFGMVIGDAFFRVAEGTMTAKQALAELVRMFAQMGAQRVFGQIGGAVGSAFAPTQTQATADGTAPATPPGGGGGFGL